MDRSGSMGWNNVNEEMASALNTYFKDQAALEGECLVDYVQFDTQYEEVFSDTPAGQAKAVIEPRGGTALVDAIGRGTEELGRKLRKMKESERPGTVIVVVITDGEENSSRKFTAEQVKQMVRKQEDQYNWQYVFLGANIDAVATGAMYGFQHGNSMTYDTGNTVAVAASLSAHSHTTRVAGAAAAAFSDEDRFKAVDKS